jgi:hypothetical protein
MKRVVLLLWLAVLCAWTGLVANFAQHHDGMVWRNLSPAVWFLQGVPLEATYTPSSVISIQSGSITITDTNTSNTATITSVGTTTSAVTFTGQWGTDGANIIAYFGRVDLTNATTVTATRADGTAGGTLTVGYQVVSFLPQFIKSLQKGTIVMTNGGSTSNTAIVTSVNTAKAFLLYGGTCSSDTVTSGNQVNALQNALTLTNATTVTATRNSSAGTGSTVGFTLVEFK